ncbi:hypothetical protein M514_23481 [Trichuris suis]|uniref:Uncharacterized protein n=1 Tax=Trichuris suis TaxID=68888 RepID=A0A085N4B7_9BILA|nr:hypothetical protein M514_23481 [Trichuris suis]
MKNGKATGADDLPSDFWELCGPVAHKTTKPNHCTQTNPLGLENQYNDTHMERQRLHRRLFYISANSTNKPHPEDSGTLHTPSAWKTSITIPIWKGKGYIADYSTYRPIRLTSHTLKILE